MEIVDFKETITDFLNEDSNKDTLFTKNTVILCETVKLREEAVKQFFKLVEDRAKTDGKNINPELMYHVDLDDRPTTVLRFRGRRFVFTVEPTAILSITSYEDLWFVGIWGEPPDYDQEELWRLTDFQKNDARLKPPFKDDSAFQIYRDVIYERYNGYAGYGQAESIADLTQFLTDVCNQKSG